MRPGVPCFFSTLGQFTIVRTAQKYITQPDDDALPQKLSSSGYFLTYLLTNDDTIGSLFTNFFSPCILVTCL